MQTQRFTSRVRVTALALLTVVGIAGATVASAGDDHASPGHSAGHGTESKAAPKAAPKSKPAPKQLVPAANPAPDHADAPERATAPTLPAPTSSSAASSASPEPTGPVTADQALALLNEGNQRWVADKERNPNATPSRREQTASGQNPFVTVLTCADSRLPVERIFDRGVGDVFVVRVAGNVAGQSETGTIEYGLEHLHTPVLVVMGHTKCGAVAAAASGAKIHGALGGLVDHIRPAVDRARSLNPNATPDEVTAAAVRENVWQTIYDLYSTSSEVRSLVSNSSVKVVGAIYDISTGQVEWIGEHPWQREIIAALDARPSDTAFASHAPHAKPAPAAPINTPNDAHADASDSHEGH
jgi:carbonic anhydrase